MQELKDSINIGVNMDKLKYLPEGGRINREGYWTNEVQRQCTSCRQIFYITSKTVTLCKTCNVKRVKSLSPEFKMYQRAKSRAKKFGRDFNIDLDDIFIPKTCPILGIPLVVHSGQPGGFPDSPALDRLDSSGGYTKGNVWVISQRANQMKADADIGEMKAFARWVLKQFNQ